MAEWWDKSSVRLTKDREQFLTHALNNDFSCLGMTCGNCPVQNYDGVQNWVCSASSIDDATAIFNTEKIRANIKRYLYDHYSRRYGKRRAKELLVEELL